MGGSSSTPTGSRLSSSSNATPRPIPGRLNYNANASSSASHGSSSARSSVPGSSSFDMMGSSPTAFNGSPGGGGMTG